MAYVPKSRKTEPRKYGKREMKALIRFLRLPLMAIGIAIELMLIPIAWVVRFVEEHTDKEAK